MLSGGETPSSHPVVSDRTGPSDAVGAAHGGDARRTPQTEERQPGHDGDVPVPVGSVQRAQHQTQRGSGSAQRAV